MLPSRQVLIGMILGALSATALAAMGPGWALADEEQPQGFDPANLVRFEERDYDVRYEDWVATTPLSGASVKKIEFGRISQVDIAITETGTYSSEAMFSPHIQYPGISVEPLTRSGSLIHLRTGSQRIVTDGRDACVLSRSFVIC